MYDAELREEKRAYQEIQREIDKLINIYESQIKKMMSEFSKIDGSAEKQIEAQLNDLEKNIKNIKKEFKKAIDEQKKNYLKLLDDERDYAMKRLNQKTDSLFDEYQSVLSSCFVFKGDL